MIEYKRCDQVDDKLIYDTFKEGFSDYIVKLEISFEDFLKRFFDVDCNRREYSHIALNGEKGVGVIFGGINLHDDMKSIRCGALSIVPEYRGKGVAQELLRLHKQTANDQDCDQMVLEVIAGNDRAIRFYEKSDYKKKHDWYIYTADNISFLNDAQSHCVRQITIDELKDYRAKNVNYHIAWSNEIFCIERRDAMHYGAFEGEKLLGVISMQGETVLFLHVLDEYRRKGYGRALIKKAIKQDAKSINTFFSAQKELEGFLNSNGFNRGKISQHEMALEL